MGIYNRKKTSKKNLKNLIWERLGLDLERFWEGFWRLLGPLGLFLGIFFSWLYLEWSSKALLEASGLDFDSIFRGLGGILWGFWVGFEKDFKRLWVILDFSGLFCVIEAFWGYLGRVLAGAACLFACFCWLLVAFACFCLLVLAIACYRLLWLVFPCFSCFSRVLWTILGGIWLALPACLLAFACLCLLLLASARYCSWNWFWTGTCARSRTFHRFWIKFKTGPTFRGTRFEQQLKLSNI